MYMRQKLEFIIKLLIYACFFVPLIVIPSSFIFPFIVPKIVVMRTLIEVALGAYVLLLFLNWKEYRPAVTPLTLAVLMFYVVSFGLSTFIGVDAYHSFWDNHERMLGLFTILHYVAFYLLCVKFLKNWTAWKWAMRFFFMAGTIVMFIGLLQVGNPNMLLNQGSERVASTLGNPIYVGGYALFLTFLGTLLLLKDKNHTWKYVYGFLMIFSVLGIFYSGTRGSMLGLLAGVGVSLAVYAIALRGYAKTRISIGALIVLVVFSVGALYMNRDSDFVQRIPAVGRAVNTSLSDVMASPRWVAWQIAWQSFVEKPVFGWGPNNYFYAFNAHYQPKSLSFGYGETWFDNAHNIVMNTLAVQGAVGILSYFALFAVAAWVLIGAYRKRSTDVHLLAIGCGFLTAHFIGNVTVFENITSYLYFMFWLAMIDRLVQQKENIETVPQSAGQENVPEKSLNKGLILAVGLVLIVFVYFFNIKPATANMKTLDAIKGLSSDPVLGYEKMKVALSVKSPHIDDIRSDISRTASQLLFSYGGQINHDLAVNIARLTYEEMQKNTSLHPADVRNYISLSQIAQVRAYLENNPMYLQEAINFLIEALDYSPKRQQVEYSLSMLYAQVGETDKAVKLLDQTILNNPVVAESYWRLAYIYKMTGNDKKAREVIDKAKAGGVVFSAQDEATLLQIFATTTPATATAK